MKKGMLLLLCLAMLLCGCAGKNEGPIATNESQTPTSSPEKETPVKLAMGSEIWMEFPTLTYGVMEYEKLQVLPWNSGRCEATSFDSMAETALGFYMCPMNRLYYADKTDLSNWVPVCGNPDCKHLGTSCDAFVQYREFVIKGDRIYYHSMSGVDNELYSGGATMFLASMAANGSNKRLEYAPDTYVPTTYLQDMAFLTSGQYIYNVIGMNADGSATAYSYMVTASGEETVQQVEIPDADEAGSAALRSGRTIPVYGDRLLHNGITCQTPTTYLRDIAGEPEAIELAELPAFFGYLSGDVLRFFRSNDGYYDRNIKTGEETKLADAQLDNSFACVVLPNCIVESTLMTYASTRTEEYYTEGMTHAMKLFDGETWHTVSLPEELKNASAKVSARIHAVTSDSVIITVVFMDQSIHTTYYYRIDLTKDALEAEQFWRNSVMG